MDIRGREKPSVQGGDLLKGNEPWTGGQKTCRLGWPLQRPSCVQALSPLPSGFSSIKGEEGRAGVGRGRDLFDFDILVFLKAKPIKNSKRTLKEKGSDTDRK